MFLFLACALCAVGISHLDFFFFFFLVLYHSFRKTQTKTWRQMMMMGQGEMDQMAKTTPPGHNSSYM